MFICIIQTFSQGWYQLGFALEKKEYVKRCINKAKLQMHCNGTCQLIKRIKQNKEKESSQEIKVIRVDLPAVIPDINPVISNFICFKTTITVIGSSGVPINYACTLLQPPEFHC